VSESPRRVAIDALLRIEDGAFAHLVLPPMLRQRQLAPRDRGLVTDLVYGTTRVQRTVDFLLTPLSSRPLETLDPPVRAALRLGAYQLLRGVPAHAAVAETVDAVAPRSRGFVNGVLRALARAGPPWPLPEGDSTEALGVQTSHPDWIVQTLVDEYGMDDAQATLKLDNEPPAVTLRVNRTRSTTTNVEAELTSGGVEFERGALVPDSLVLRRTGDVAALPSVVSGRATPQDQSSQAVVALLDPRSAELVLDVAAAPGGKATAAAECMDGTGLVVAADLHPGRVRALGRAVQRLGLDHVVAPVAADGRALPVRDGVFDRVLLDAPCSGLGVLRRRPDARWRIEPTDVATLAALQQQMLAAAARVVRAGGRLVYSVCTLTREETLGVDEWARHHLPEFIARPVPAAPWRPHGRGALLLPADASTDGMFVLVLERSLYPPDR
jgi:16S rRNA (cytosine967-C5)-methyltransferase